MRDGETNLKFSTLWRADGFEQHPEGQTLDYRTDEDEDRTSSAQDEAYKSRALFPALLVPTMDEGGVGYTGGWEAGGDAIGRPYHTDNED